MRTLSMLSFLGLMAFIGFSSVSHGDVYEEPPQQCDPCRVYDQYDETVDPDVIIKDLNINNYVSVDVNSEPTWRDEGRRHDRHHRRHHDRRYPRRPGSPNYGYPSYPTPGVAICRVYQVGVAGWNQIADLWIGNRWYQRGPIGVILNSYRYFVSSGQCYPGSGYL